MVLESNYMLCSVHDGGSPARQWIRIRGMIIILGIILIVLTMWANEVMHPSNASMQLETTKDEGHEFLGSGGGSGGDEEHPLRSWTKISISHVAKSNEASKDNIDETSTREQPEPQKQQDSNATATVVDMKKESVHESSQASNENDENTRSLIDFGIVGFEKCGTTFLLENIFSPSKQVFMAGAETGSEVQALDPEDLDKLRAMFLPHWNETTKGTAAGFQGGKPIRRGFKNPMVYMNRPWLDNLETNFPSMKFIVTVRHPITWFKSWYNYKLRTGHYEYPMPSPHETIGLCREACRHKGPEGTCIQVRSPGCSGHSNFHHYLSRMGYTSMTSDDELKLLDHHQMTIFNFSSTQLFLTELGQMSGKNMTVSNDLIRSMERFLDLEQHALPDIEPYRQPNYAWTEDKLEGSIDNICDPEYDDIRVHLLDIGRKAGGWIERYFLQSPHVVVSDRQDLIHRIQQWKVDPCENK